MSEAIFAIAIDRATPLQREQVQEIVSKQAEKWWHGFADLWLVSGKSAVEWRDLVGVIFLRGDGNVLVLKIDTASQHTWASRASWSDSQREWLYESL